MTSEEYRFFCFCFFFFGLVFVFIFVLVVLSFVLSIFLGKRISHVIL